CFWRYRCSSSLKLSVSLPPRRRQRRTRLRTWNWMERKDGPMLATKWKQLPFGLEYDVLWTESMPQFPVVRLQPAGKAAPGGTFSSCQLDVGTGADGAAPRAICKSRDTDVTGAFSLDSR